MFSLNHTIWLAILPALVGCATSSLRVSSTPPGADVYLTYEGEQPNKIGQTPLNLDRSLIDARRGKSVTVTIKKDGYQGESVIVPLGTFASAVDVSTRLDQTKLPSTCADSTTSIDRISRGIALVQTLIKSKNTSEAQAKLTALLNDYPDVSVLHDLMGNVLYMNKDLRAALRSYERSLQIDPTNTDTQRIATKLRSIVGGTNGAGGI